MNSLFTLATDNENNQNEIGGDKIQPQRLQEFTLAKNNENNPNESDGDKIQPQKLQDLSWRFLEGLLNGIALPFPSLRKILSKTHFVRRTRQQQQQEQQNEGRKDSQMNQNNVHEVFTFSLKFRESVALLLSYLTLGVITYSFVLEKWSIVDSLYFTCVCFTTVGYGDLSPTTKASKLFTCFFGLGGIAFLGTAVAVISGRIAAAEAKALESTKKKIRRQRYLKVFEDMPVTLKKHRNRILSGSGESIAAFTHNHHHNPTIDRIVYSLEQSTLALTKKAKKRISSSASLFQFCKRVVRRAKKVLIRVLPTLSIVFVGGTIMQYLNGSVWSWYETLYYALVTASTIGFGDLYPQTQAAKLFAMLFIPISVAAVGELLSGVALSIVRRRQRDVYEQQLQRDLTMEHLMVMDNDGDGKITRDEYIVFMLIEMGLVNAEEVQQLDDQFRRLDQDGSGFLDTEDLKLMAQLRGVAVKE